MTDGKCSYAGCEREIDWKKHDKPPPGWATVSFTRYGKRNSRSHATFLVCIDHTVVIARRQLGLTLAGPATENESSILDRSDEILPAKPIHGAEEPKRKGRR